MQLVLGIFAIVFAVCYLCRWPIIVFITLVGMITGGFGAGVVAGFVTWAFFKATFYFMFVVAGYKILSVQGPDHE